MDFQPGDVVQLKSGGPRMTVEAIRKDKDTEEDVVWCIWSEKVGNRTETHKEPFHPATIQKWQLPRASFVTRRV